MPTAAAVRPELRCVHTQGAHTLNTPAGPSTGETGLGSQVLQASVGLMGEREWRWQARTQGKEEMMRKATENLLDSALWVKTWFSWRQTLGFKSYS